MIKSDDLRAVAYIWSGMLIIGLVDNAMPLITPTSSLWVFHAVRSVMVLAMLGGMALVQGWSLRPNRPGRVYARNLFSTTAMFLYFGALAFVPIGVAVAGLFTAPLFVLLFSVLFRGQRVGVVRWAAVLAGFAGALLVIQPDEGALGWASAVPVLAGVFYATGALATRSWCEGEGTMPMVFSYFVILALGGLAGLAALAIWPQPAVDGPAGFVARGWVWPEGTVLFWIVVQAVTAIAAVGCLTRGYQIGEATYVAVNEYSLILFATVFAFLFWGQAVGTGALIGMALIVAAGMVITLRSDPSEAEAPAAMPAGAMTVIEEGEAGP